MPGRPGAAATVTATVRPAWPLRLPGGGPDGVLRRSGAGIERLLHVGAEPVVVRVEQPAPERIVFVAAGPTAEAGEAAIARMRFALAIDDELREFHVRFRSDPLIGASVRRRPHLRVRRRPEPFEALAWAVTEQLIDFARAVGIQRRLLARFGRRCARTGLVDVPAAAALAAAPPAALEACGLSPGRALSLRRAAIAVASGRADLHAVPHEGAWARLGAIPGIGTWTLDLLALHGQGRYERLPAGDLHYLKLVGRLRSGGDPRARATEDEVREFFAPYGPWAGLAGVHAGASGVASRPPARTPRSRHPPRGGTRSSAPSRRSRAA